MERHENGTDEVPTPVSPNRGGRRFALYAASSGRYYFREIRDLVAAGMKELGHEVETRDETKGFSANADWHVVIAPHEFVSRRDGPKLRRRETPPHLILVNTAQPSTHESSSAYALSDKTHYVWDIRYDLAHHMSARGYRCDYLPLGHVSSQNVPMEAGEVPHTSQSTFLVPEVTNGSPFHEPIADRPIDVLFIGALTPKREEFFVKAAPVLSRYRCHLDFLVESDPHFPGETRHIEGTIAAGLAKRSKLVVNLHRGKELDFEWRRIVMYGMWQRACVVSEQCAMAPPFRPPVDYAALPLEEMPEKIDYYLSTPEGLEEAQITALRGFRTLTEHCKMKDHLRRLITKLHSTESE